LDQRATFWQQKQPTYARRKAAAAEKTSKNVSFVNVSGLYKSFTSFGIHNYFVRREFERAQKFQAIYKCQRTVSWQTANRGNTVI
jgi:hypothetical protein